MSDSDFSQQIRGALRPGGLEWQLLFRSSLDSTNAQLKRLAQQGQAHGSCLMADFQTAGRGRQGRSWQAPAGRSLLFSLLLRPPVPVDQLFAFTALASLSLCYALEEQGLNPQIKWPNDVYLQGAKLAGILSEIDGSSLFLIIGMGVNVNQSTEELAVLDQAAVSLQSISGKQWQRASLLSAILNHMSALYLQWEGDSLAWLAPYQARSWLLGQQVIVRDGKKLAQGKAVAIETDCALLLQVTDRERVAVSYGDVSILAIDRT